MSTAKHIWGQSLMMSIPVSRPAVLRPLKDLHMPQDDDLSLIQRVVAKDRHAFETLYQRYYRQLYSYLMKMLHRTDVVEEVLNDVMMVVWSDAERFNRQSKLSTWIFGIAYHKALKALHQATRDHSEPESDLPEGADLDGPEHTLLQQEIREGLEKALKGLSPEHRSVIEFAFFHGFSYAEIAKMMDCPVNTVKTRIFHARKRLGELLTPSEGPAVIA